MKISLRINAVKLEFRHNILRPLESQSLSAIEARKYSGRRENFMIRGLRLTQLILLGGIGGKLLGI
jgi:hypothetical protein